MKILYGVQGTGNGHTTRARMMAEELKQHDVSVDYLFSGKDETYFNMEVFGDYRSLPGLSFVVENGQVNYLKTITRNNPVKFYKDLKALDLAQYDLVINDFEPISAWAAKLQKIPCVGLSHQNAFRYKVPVRGNNPIASLILKWFAPADFHIAFHWSHFNQPILPPMINTSLHKVPVNERKILVYLPFLQQTEFHDVFHRFPGYDFVQYHPVINQSSRGNVHGNLLSRENFLQDFSDCAGIICSAGFGLCSEALHYGKKLLVMPLQGQMEQLSNAAALQQLAYGTVVERLNRKNLEQWLNSAKPNPVKFPNVAKALALWIVEGRKQSISELSKLLWSVPHGCGMDNLSTTIDLETQQL